MNRSFLTNYFLLFTLWLVCILVSCKEKESEPEPVTPHNPAGGELLHYDFDKDVMDRGEHKYHGKLIGEPGFVEGKKGSALYLNETDGKNECDQPGGQYVQVPPIGRVWEKGFTVSAWVEFKDNRKFERILDLGNGLGETNGRNVTFSRYEKSNDLVLTSWVNSDPAFNREHGRLIAKDVIVNNKMQHYAATISPSGEMKIFVNGEKKAEQKNGSPVLNVYREKNFIGHSSYCYIDPDLKGIIDDIRIYNKELSEVEIKELFLY